MQENNVTELDKDEIKYYQEFIQTFSSMNDMGFYYNPMMNNQFLKNVNMNPYYRNRDDVENMVYDPSSNELGLRRLAQHLYNTQNPFKKLIHYYADSLTFDWYPVPINATEEDMKSKEFKKDYDRMWKWFDRFNVKKEFKKILLGMMLEDGKFTYLREGKNRATLQEMPSEYCLIDSWSQLGWLYSFNLMYFQQMGVDPNSFPDEFMDFYKQAMLMKEKKINAPGIKQDMRNGTYAYWKQIDPKNGWVFKFHDNFATLIPPYLGLFIDAIEINTSKKLQEAKESLEAYKVIFGQIPRHKDGSNKGGNIKDDFAVDPKTLAKYTRLVKSSLPDGVDLKVMPLDDVKLFEFDSGKNDSVGNTMRNFYRSAGADQALFNSEKPNASTMKASTRMDSAFVERCYEQFNEFCTYHVNTKTKKFKFRIKFEGTIWDEENRQEQAMKLAERGIITPKLASAHSMTLKELESSVNLMQHLGFPEKLVPLSSTHTASDSPVGRTAKSDSDISDSGEKTRDAGSNVDKE